MPPPLRIPLRQQRFLLLIAASWLCVSGTSYGKTASQDSSAEPNTEAKLAPPFLPQLPKKTDEEITAFITQKYASLSPELRRSSTPEIPETAPIAIPKKPAAKHSKKSSDSKLSLRISPRPKAKEALKDSPPQPVATSKKSPEKPVEKSTKASPADTEDSEDFFSSLASLFGEGWTPVDAKTSEAKPVRVAQATHVQQDVSPAPKPAAPATPPESLGSLDALPTPQQRPALSQESKAILEQLAPPQTAPTAASVFASGDIDRVNPEVSDIIKKAGEHYESAGVSIRVTPSYINTSGELQRAYDALMLGNLGEGISIYQTVLRNDPANEDALFGLAAAYHKAGQLQNARSLYGRLLRQNPAHREGLSNFLQLVSDEAPEEALAELARLEAKYPGFSPVPAQMGLLLERLHQPEVAQSKLLRAIELSPENMMYKYNLAVLLDRQRHYAAAAPIYKELINASLQGTALPVDMNAIQQRYTYIAAKRE